MSAMTYLQENSLHPFSIDVCENLLFPIHLSLFHLLLKVQLEFRRLHVGLSGSETLVMLHWKYHLVDVSEYGMLQPLTLRLEKYT